MSGLPRPYIDLDGEWTFVPDPERLLRPSDLPEGTPIRVPGCWESTIERPYRIITAWYRRNFTVPPEWEGRRLLLHFGAVMYQCEAWLNGQPIGDHQGGYTPFTLDGTGAAAWGAENDLIVRVVNPLNAITDYPALAVERILLAQELEPDLPLSQAPHGKQTWYSSTSGLWQSVRAEAVAETYIAGLRVLPEPSAELARVRWRLTGQRPVKDLALELRVIAPDGSDAAHETVHVRAGASRGEAVVQVPQPVLWDIGQPNLYRLEARLLATASADDGGATDGLLDTVVTRFGMREITARDGQIVLNGRPVYMLGALDQDHYPDTIATPPSRELLDEQIRRAQEMGLNLLRCHIKVPDPAYVEAADEAGILLWCELPNWTRFTSAAAERGRATLEAMVETLGNHPSIVIWTIINEDWGTKLRYEARDRQWLAGMYEWLKALDPTRLVVDNSACETPRTPNFHVRSDLADFHLYFAAPDNAVRWRNAVADFAARPPWLWSPHGDARPTGHEPLLLTEFGTWGLPRLDRLVQHYRREPWWFGTGQGYYRPGGLQRRFVSYGLDRVWPDVNALAEATQWHQFEAMQYEIGQLRRHGSINGYVVTEFSDTYWEVNGLLDVTRRPKVYHERLRELNAPEVVVADVDRRDVWDGDAVAGDLYLSSYLDDVPARGTVSWRLLLSDGRERGGQLDVAEWPRFGCRPLGRFSIEVPPVSGATDARLVVIAADADGRERARTDMRIAVLPSRARATEAPRWLAVHDPLEIWGLTARVERLGHTFVAHRDAELLVASELTDEIVRFANRGGSVLLLVRARDAVPRRLDVARRVNVQLRRLPHTGWPGQPSPWDGDWVTAFSWLLPESLPGLPARAPLDFAYEEALPDHVLLGYDPARHRDEVTAGMFAGWVHAPAALTWTFPQGAGRITMTTFRLSPEDGPVATVMLEGLIQATAGASRAVATAAEPVERGLGGTSELVRMERE